PYVYCRCSFAMLLLRSGVSGCLYLTRTSPDITSLPVVVLSYGHRRCHVHLTSAVFTWKNHAHHDVLRQPMYLSTPRRIFQTIFGNVGNSLSSTFCMDTTTLYASAKLFS